MAKESEDKQKGLLESIGKEVHPGLGEVAGRFAYVREDGAICFGDECVVIKAQDNGKLHLEIKPTRCGEETGRVLVDHLVKTAGKGVVIEIASEESTK